METTTADIKPKMESQVKQHEAETEKIGPDSEETIAPADAAQRVEESGTECEKSAEDLAADGLNKLNDGKRNLACDEYPQAVDALAEACQLLSAKYGEEASELAEAYYYYGRALLELARMENGVLGNALDGVSAEEENEAELSESEQFEKPEEVKDCERDELRTQIYTAMSTDEKESQDKTSSEPASSADSTTEDEKADDKPTEKSADAVTPEAESTKAAEGSDKAKEGEAQETGEEEGGEDENAEGEDAEDEAENMEDDEEVGSQDEGEDNPDDVPNLQLAWEVLELAKKIYLRQTETPDCEKSIKVKLSDVYRSLGEVSLETGSSEQAVLDITSCLTLQQQCVDKDSRYIAETHYQLGNAYLLNKDYSLGVEQLQLAKSVLEMRIKNLEERMKAEDIADSDKQAKELTDLKQLLPDILAKVEDAEDESRNAALTEAKLKAAISSGATTIGFGDTSENSAVAATNGTPIAVKKANDISNLVRKRKPEEQANGDTAEVKKAKSDTDIKVSGDKENGQGEVTSQ